MVSQSNSQAFPWLEQIQDATVRQALRFIWEKLQYFIATVQNPTSGTLQPDQKPPNLGVNDAGRRFYAVDYNRTFRWTGTAWEDAPDAPPRFQVTFFAAPPEPAVGWAACNGASVNRSTSIGGTQYFQTPTIPAYTGMFAYIRL